MPELDPFDARLTDAVHALADRAETDVDALAVAERAISAGRRGRFAWAWAAVPVPVSILVVLGLLVGLLAWSLAVGGPRRDQSYVVPSPTPTATTAMATSTVTPEPSTDGEGDEYVVGTETSTVTTDYAETKVGDVTQLRGATLATVATMNDPRVSGTGTLRFSADLYPAAVGPLWGTYHLQNGQGAWDGPCRGAGWQAGDLGARACWLTGSGAFAGFSYYLQVASLGTSLSDAGVRGLIFPGSPPPGEGED